MTAELVGPLPTISFYGAGRERVRHAYEPPRDTCDLRARLCTDHHPACDCREAEFAEDRLEMRNERRAQTEVIRRVLAGHVVHAPMGADDDACCQCTGCQIVRDTYLLSFAHISFRTGIVR